MISNRILSLKLKNYLDSPACEPVNGHVITQPGLSHRFQGDEQVSCRQHQCAKESLDATHHAPAINDKRYETRIPDALVFPQGRSLGVRFCLTLLACILIVYPTVSLAEGTTDTNNNTNPDAEHWNDCYSDAPMPNDLAPIGSMLPFFNDWNPLQNWSVGATPSIKLLQYTFGKHQAASFDPSVGMGVSFRYYGYSSLHVSELEYDSASTKTADEQKKELHGFTKEQIDSFNKKWGKDILGKEEKEDTKKWRLPLSHIKSKCRRSTTARLFGTGADNQPFLANAMFSITPMIYVKNPVSSGQSSTLTVQPAIVAGFFQDIVNVGVGFNLTGPDTGKVFLLVSLGYGLQF